MQAIPKAVAPVPPADRPARAREEFAARLARHGASASFVERVRADVAALEGELHPLDAAAEAIAALFPPFRLMRRAAGTRVLAFAGPAGAGKTSAIARLARRLRDGGRRVELAALETRRTGALEPLHAWSRRLAIPLTVLRRSVRLDPARMRAADVDLVLLEASGAPEQAAGELARVRARLESAGAAFDVCAVLPASASPAALARAVDGLRALVPAAALVTRLDETGAPVPALEAGLALGARLAFLCDPAREGRELVRADGERAADLCLRGRLA